MVLPTALPTVRMPLSLKSDEPELKSQVGVLTPLEGFLEFDDVELDLLLHFSGDPGGLFLVAVAHHFDEYAGDDLPAHTEFVVDPAAYHFLATVFQDRVPVTVDCLLVAAVDAE